MKHDPNVIAILITVFVVAQIVGLTITFQYLDYDKTVVSGDATFKNLPFDTPRPEVDQSNSYILIMAAILVGTALVLTIIKFGKMRMWKIWFFLSIMITLTIALSAFLPEYIAAVIALILAYYKIRSPGFWVHNISEVFIYGGLAAILTPIINLFSAFMLLVLISLYDMYAVWKSEHMVTMAKSQTSSKLFAGLMVPYEKGAKSAKGIVKSGKPKSALKVIPKGAKVKRVKNAILGGGDVGFPLIFAGVVMKTLLMNGVDKMTTFAETAIIVILTTLALTLLMKYGKQDKFYPAMPFLSAGCLVGYVIIFVLNRLII